MKFIPHLMIKQSCFDLEKLGFVNKKVKVQTQRSLLPVDDIWRFEHSFLSSKLGPCLRIVEVQSCVFMKGSEGCKQSCFDLQLFIFWRSCWTSPPVSPSKPGSSTLTKKPQRTELKIVNTAAIVYVSSGQANGCCRWVGALVVDGRGLSTVWYWPSGDNRYNNSLLKC